MGLIKNIFHLLSGKKKNHIFHDQGATWGFATQKAATLKRLEGNEKFLTVFELLFGPQQITYVFTAALSEHVTTLSPEAQANIRMEQWEKGENRFVAYNRLVTSIGTPACCGYSGILKSDSTEDRILQIHYFSYSKTGKELFLTMSKKCPPNLVEKMPDVVYTGIVTELNDVYTILTSIRIF